MVRSATGGLRGVWRELRQIGRRGRQVWQLVPRHHRWALGGALLIVSLASAGNTAVAILLGELVKSLDPKNTQDLTPGAIMKGASVYLGLLGLAYLVRESMNVLRRYLVENTCTRINKDMRVRLVGHLMKVDLSFLAQDQVGALYGRMNRSADGFVRFLRISFLDFVPALFIGVFALSAALYRQPWVALVMVGVVPVSLCQTIWQLITERDPARPDADARGDGRDRRRAALGNRLRASRQHRSPGDPPRCANGREAAVQGNPAPLRDVTFRLRQGAQRGILSHPRSRLRSLPVRSRPAPRYRRYLHLLRPLPERDVPPERGSPLH